MSDARTIVVRGAREHNLRNVSLTLPHGKLICFTGVSGSGKSSFAFDTLYAEGQRRYLESLSSYARQFLGQLAKPDVDQITGLSPSISIQQKTSGWNPRSTVGTITQIHDYLRVLFARIGMQHCPQCGKPITAQTREQIVARIMEFGEATKLHILAPVIRGQKGEHRDLFEDMLRKGYARARVDGIVYSLTDPPQLTKNVRHDIEIVVDRIVRSATGRARLAEAVEQALKLGEGSLIVQQVDSDQSVDANQLDRSKPSMSSKQSKNSNQSKNSKQSKSSRQSKSRKTAPSPFQGEGGGEGQTFGDSDPSPLTQHSPQRGEGNARRGTDDLLLSSQFACASCRMSFSAPSPQLFSFNSPQGMCLNCEGLGTSYDFDPDLLVPNPKKSFLNLAIEPMRTRIGRWRRHIYRGVARHVGFDLEAPWAKLPKKARTALLYGLGDDHVTYEWKWSGGVWRHGGKFEGIVAELREKHRKAQSPMVRAYYEKYMRKATCQSCKGARLNTQALSIRIADTNLNDVCAMSVRDAREWAGSLMLTKTEQAIANDVLREIRGRLGFLCDVGLDYLSLDRTAPTLSGGESQRIRLASQIGAGLVGVLYVLDEPSIGLHPRDNDRLLRSLLRLRDMGNTVIVVEHDEQTMLAADEIVDFGPGPGVRGGEIVAHGDLETVRRSERSITGQFLRGEERIEIPTNRRPVKSASTPKNRSPKTPDP